MPIAIPPRKGLRAKSIAVSNPDLPVAEVARRAGLDRSAAAKAVRQTRFGRDRLKSRAPDA
jgi:hypothetical protein